MTRFLGLLVLAAAALAEERPLSDLRILKWQVEAQAHERSRARRLDPLGEEARPEPSAVVEAGGMEPRPTKPVVKPTCVAGSQNSAAAREPPR